MTRDGGETIYNTYPRKMPKQKEIWKNPIEIQQEIGKKIEILDYFRLFFFH
jgi:hypothetical protein